MPRQSRSQGFSGERPPNKLNLTRYCLANGVQNTPDKPALVVIKSDLPDDAVETWTYQNLESGILSLAHGLQRLGVAKGDRVMIDLANTSTYALLFFAASAIGAIPLPVSDQLTNDEVQFLNRNAAPAMIATTRHTDVFADGHHSPVFVTPNNLDAMIRAGDQGIYADTDANDPAYLIYTSGTTAEPKGVLHAHRAAWGRRPMYQDWYGITKDDRMLHAGAFNWTYTLGTGLMDPWVNGATAYVCTGKRTPALWPSLIRQTQATLFAAVPGVFRQILKYGQLENETVQPPFPTLRHGLTAGETPPPSLFEGWHNATRTPLYEALGMSEISTYISTGPNIPRQPGAVGKAQTGRSIAILADRLSNDAQDEPTRAEPLPAGKDGRLAVHRSDPGLMLGYWNRPKEEHDVFEGDWFVGGDRAVISSEGYVTHLGRSNDIMKALGYRVAPQEVEQVLVAHPCVSDAACAEVQVREGVSIIVAFVVPTPGQEVNKTELIETASRHLADYKVPKDVTFVDELPRTRNGKVKRTALSNLYQSNTEPKG